MALDVHPSTVVSVVLLWYIASETRITDALIMLVAIAVIVFFIAMYRLAREFYHIKRN